MSKKKTPGGSNSINRLIARELRGGNKLKDGMSDKEKGLFKKYSVIKYNGKKIDDCLVMEFDDIHARRAIKAFEKSVRKAGYIALADDIIHKLNFYGVPKS